MTDCMYDERKTNSELDWIYEYYKYLYRYSKFADEEAFQKIREARVRLGYAWQNVHTNVKDTNYKDKVTKMLEKLNDDQIKSVFDYMENNGLI